MLPVGTYISRQQSMRTNKVHTIVCLFVAICTFSGCSKSSEDNVTRIPARELAAINNSLMDYMFLKRYFDEPDRLWAFLQELAVLHYDSYPFVASGGTLWSVRRDEISAWLKAKEKNEVDFRKLCPDPQFVVAGNNWKVIFNVFKKDGSVDQWQVVGEHDPQKKYNQVEKIEITTLKPSGTFFCPMMG